MAKDKGRSEDALTFPMAPMLDVVFQVLVFFVATYRADVPEAHLAVNLPAPGPVKVGKPVKFLELQVYADRLQIRNKTFAYDDLKNEIMELGRMDPTMTVVIKVSPKAKTEDLVRMLDLCNLAGLKSLNLVTMVQ